jgi:hypothetical protein
MTNKVLAALGSDGSIVTRTMLPYSVSLWGSHPDACNDDCWTGDEFATLEDALACYRALAGSIGNFALAEKLSKVTGHDWEYVEIDGPDVHDVLRNPDQKTQGRHRREAQRSNAEWQREIAHQAGMAFGCDGYNDMMGY